MKSLEKFSTIFLIAGLGFFFVAFFFLGIWPAQMTESFPDENMPQDVPTDFKIYYKNVTEYHEALRSGRDSYISDGCWHCHSQYVRPISNEALYYGNVSTPMEYENELNLPQLFGTRRVGPDLTRVGGKRTNDWHFAHLYNPKNVEPHSIMPVYSWYFDESTSPPTPTKRGVALVAYIQQLGHWVRDVKRDSFDLNEITMPPGE